MESEIITLKKALEILESGEIVELEVYTYDEKRKRGGDILSLQCVILRDEKNKVITSNSNHAFFTRNVRIVVNNHLTAQIRQIHPTLIRYINGKKTVV